MHHIFHHLAIKIALTVALGAVVASSRRQPHVDPNFQHIAPRPITTVGR